MSAVRKSVYILGGSIFIPSRVVGYQATGSFSEGCQPMHVDCSATSNNIHVVGVISSFVQSSGSSRYRQFSRHPELKVSYRLITSAARNNLYIFDASKLPVSCGSGTYRQLL
ncbi:predicted protein [Lichtheimia corymbifera JMRC:FSU:9682]|uniref:Uncharacterized protein n=1 Tax=Lichtheimia corymbifera JMRC:FSU:9682 TaxID=1263082 RepID=A0A068RWC5_9FUNG|nr:predicted protein [Lichtheimia corymbifera JMRC:FSU:9682]